MPIKRIELYFDFRKIVEGVVALNYYYTVYNFLENAINKFT